MQLVKLAYTGKQYQLTIPRSLVRELGLKRFQYVSICRTRNDTLELVFLEESTDGAGTLHKARPPRDTRTG